MMKFKKNFAAVMAAVMTGAMAFGLVATTAPVAKVYASGNDETSSSTTTTKHDKPTVDYEKMTLTITDNGPYVFLEVYKDATKTDKVSATYCYPVASGKAVIDLGFMKATKAFGVRVYGSSDMSEAAKSDMLVINPQPGKLSFKVKATETDFLKAIDKWKEGKSTTKPTDATALAAYEYRTLYGTDWNGLDEFSALYANAKIAGTTIVVRKAAEPVDADDETAGAPAGPEAKIKISAAPKAPKVTVDYVNGTVKVTDKMQIAKLGTAALEDGDFKNAEKNMKIADLATKVGADAKDGFTLAIRTKGTGSKADSSLTFLAIKAVPELTAGSTADTAEVTIGEAKSTVKVEKVDDGLKVTITGTAKFQYDKGSNKWAELTNGATIKADSLKVRVAPEKEDKKVAGSGSFASAEKELKPVEKDAGDDENQDGN